MIDKIISNQKINKIYHQSKALITMMKHLTQQTLNFIKTALCLVLKVLIYHHKAFIH